MKRRIIIIALLLILADFTVMAIKNKQVRENKTIELLNVSYDPTRELYKEYNSFFTEYWKQKTGKTLSIRQSHGGAGKQARAVIDGLKADVVTLALAYDIDAIAEKTKLLPAQWQSRLPENSCAYTSTIVFLVRKGNPKEIHDWADLIKPGIEVITPNPKTSGGARWNYLAAWGYAYLKALGDSTNNKSIAEAEKKAKDFITALYDHVPVLDTGARGATNTFVQRGIGDVLLAWENEAFLSINELGSDKFEIVIPSISILAEPPVTVVDKNTKANDTSEAASEYLQQLYSDKGQTLAAKHYYRPVYPEMVDSKYLEIFPEVKMFRLNELFGSWQDAQKTHFADNGIFDQIYLR